MKRIFRVGTRESLLARWQAEFISEQLLSHGIQTELVPIKSEGDIDLTTPIYQMGIQGVFTKTLDAALLSNRIDIAVHSLKDVPTALPEGLTLAAVPEREDVQDMLICKEAGFDPDKHANAVIATGSLRRRAQWLNKYPEHRIEELRGNIHTRLEKLKNNSDWDAVILASAGIKRMKIQPENSEVLTWMLPAPSQGALGIVCRSEDSEAFEACHLLNDSVTFACTEAERAFLKTLMGGCSMPVGALACESGSNLFFKGNILSIDGREKVEIELEFEKDKASLAGVTAANELLSAGASKIVEQIRRSR